MTKSWVLGLLLLAAGWLHAQEVVINELDCDTPGIDDKEFVELKSATPHFSLNGLVLVFFNGSAAGANSSYLALDLDGYTTDINGLLLIGSTTVSPSPQYLIPANTIQNGADAVAIYQGNPEDFPEATPASAGANLVDVLLYGTNDADATGLIAIFQAFNPAIQQINEGASNNVFSIQRNNDGTYFSGAPTPRRLNDGTGIVLNGLLTSLVQNRYDEGQSFDITFSTEQIVTEGLPIAFSLSNGAFNGDDFTGDTTLLIPAGQNSVSTTITLVDDAFDEGDEVMLLKLEEPPITFLVLNNNINIRAVDNDFSVAPFGTPISPTYGIVASTQPAGYYDSLDGLSADSLRQAMQDIIANPTVVRAQTYDDVIEILKEADQNPENSNQVWLVYLEIGRSKIDFQTTSGNFGVWNREHTFPRSRGGFDSIDTDTLDGKDIYWATNADSLRHANSDAHGIRAVDAVENSTRGNQFYGEYNGPAGTLGGFKGDVARCIFFLDVRYNGLEVVNGFPDGLTGQFGDLATLLEWHRNDPPDDFEMNRNNVVYTWQYNRNPFIDMPELAEYLWGNKVGQTWHQPVNTHSENTLNVSVYPNPASRTLHVKGIVSPTTVEVYDEQGRAFLTNQITQDTILHLDLPTGVYFIKIYTQDKTAWKKVVINN